MLIRSLGTGSLRTRTLGSLWAGSGYLPVLYAALFAAASGTQLVKAIDWVFAHNVRIEMLELSQVGNSSSSKKKGGGIATRDSRQHPYSPLTGKCFDDSHQMFFAEINMELGRLAGENKAPIVASWRRHPTTGVQFGRGPVFLEPYKLKHN